MPYKAGDRVGAIMDSSEEEVRMFGYGQYMGDEVPPPEITFMGIPIPFPNPKIVLDSGKVVWGCECWWGSEAQVKRMIGGRRVIEVDIEAARKEVA